MLTSINDGAISEGEEDFYEIDADLCTECVQAFMVKKKPARRCAL